MRWAALLLAFALPARGLIFIGTGDEEHNTTPPAAGAGWEFHGEWGLFQGIAIGPHHFITAVHIGGAVGNAFVYRGVSYPTVSFATDATTDLRVWEIRGTFPAFAELYDGPDETGAALMVFGRGATRGNPVNVNDVLKGWQWGGWDRRLRWGTNRVTSLFRDQDQTLLDPPRFLTADFNANGGADEAQLAVGDSGAGAFIQQNGTWRLAGVNWSVDGPFSFTDEGPEFNAALFDMGGLYTGNGTTWTFIPDRAQDNPSALYATRIKPRVDWIRAILALPTTPSVISSPSIEGPFELATTGTVDAATRTVRIPIGETAAFFQLESSIQRTISNVRLEGSELVFEY
jgi:hypothetical protein